MGGGLSEPGFRAKTQDIGLCHGQGCLGNHAPLPVCSSSGCASKKKNTRLWMRELEKGSVPAIFSLRARERWMKRGEGVSTHVCAVSLQSPHKFYEPRDLHNLYSVFFQCSVTFTSHRFDLLSFLLPVFLLRSPHSAHINCSSSCIANLFIHPLSSQSHHFASPLLRSPSLLSVLAKLIPHLTASRSSPNALDEQWRLKSYLAAQSPFFKWS